MKRVLAWLEVALGVFLMGQLVVVISPQHPGQRIVSRIIFVLGVVTFVHAIGRL
jgi:hypothetical protein